MVIQAWGTNLIRQQVYNSAYANVNYLSHHFNDNITSLRTTLEYIRDVDTVRELFVYQHTYNATEYYEKIAEIQDFLFRMSRSNPFIAEIRLYFPRDSFGIITRHQGYSYTLNQLPDISERIDAYRNASSLIIETDGEYRICTATGSVFSISPQLPAIYLELVLDQDALAEHLSSFTAGDEKLSFQYNHAANTVIFNNGTHLDGEAAHVFGAVLQENETVPYSTSFCLDGMDYVLIAVYTSSIHSSFGQLIHVSSLEYIPQMLRYGMLLFIVMFALVLALLTVLMYRQVNWPTKRLLAAFDATGTGRFDTRITDDMRSWPSEYQLLARHFNSMNQQTQELIAKNYEQQLNLQRAQLKQLQAQINPHFLYNSFFLLRNIVHTGDREQTERFLLCLGQYFQYITNNTCENATLEEEYMHASNYLTIQTLRFEDSLDLQIAALPEHLKKIVVPRLILQPLFENVLVHGKWNDGELRCIHLSIEETGDMVQLRISDNGKEISDKLIDTIRSKLTHDIPFEFTSGLVNIQHRLQLFCKKDGLRVSRSSMGGFEITVNLLKEP